jgi:hypothetical protein
MNWYDFLLAHQAEVWTHAVAQNWTGGLAYVNWFHTSVESCIHDLNRKFGQSKNTRWKREAYIVTYCQLDPKHYAINEQENVFGKKGVTFLETLVGPTNGSSSSNFYQ